VKQQGRKIEYHGRLVIVDDFLVLFSDLSGENCFVDAV
jgi:hypothetical protein